MDRETLERTLEEKGFVRGSITLREHGNIRMPVSGWIIREAGWVGLIQDNYYYSSSADSIAIEWYSVERISYALEVFKP